MTEVLLKAWSCLLGKGLREKRTEHFTGNRYSLYLSTPGSYFSAAVSSLEQLSNKSLTDDQSFCIETLTTMCKQLTIGQSLEIF